MLLLMGKSTNFRLGHGFNSYVNVYQRVNVLYGESEQLLQVCMCMCIYICIYYMYIYMEVSINGVFPKWTVYSFYMFFWCNNHLKLDDLGVPPFWKTSRYLWQVHTSTIYIYIQEIVDVYHISYTPITSHSITVVGMIKELQMGDELWI